MEEQRGPARPTKPVSVAASVVHRSGMNHEAHFDRISDGPAGDSAALQFTIMSDEPEFMGGDDAHPYPMHYFVAGIGF